MTTATNKVVYLLSAAVGTCFDGGTGQWVAIVYLQVAAKLTCLVLVLLFMGTCRYLVLRKSMITSSGGSFPLRGEAEVTAPS